MTNNKDAHGVVINYPKQEMIRELLELHLPEPMFSDAVLLGGIGSFSQIRL